MLRSAQHDAEGRAHTQVRPYGPRLDRCVGADVLIGPAFRGNLSFDVGRGSPDAPYATASFCGARRPQRAKPPRNVIQTGWSPCMAALQNHCNVGVGASVLTGPDVRTL